MINAGLLSVTFRKLTSEQIIALVKQAKLPSIEWGGDIHVPHGDLPRATAVRRLTEQAGLTVSAYGSYYRVGASELEGLPFEKVLASAVALGAPLIRVWAGKLGSAKADVAYRLQVVDDSKRIATLAAAHNITIGYEFHSGTLTDTNESALNLLESVNQPNVYTFWQPSAGFDESQLDGGLRSLLPRLANLHVYYWRPPNQRMPLSAGAEEWLKYLTIVQTTGRNHYASLEFVRNDDPAAFLEDAAALSSWLAQLNQ